MKIGKGTMIYKPVVMLDDKNHEIIIGEKCSIGQFSVIAPRKLVMMEGAEICPTVVLAGGGEITLGKYSTICFGVKLIPATYTTKGQYMNDNIPEKSEMIRGVLQLEKELISGLVQLFV